jgi:glycerol-3-phosphate cytidylyltransferase
MKRRVISFGVFDLLHVGHLSILTNARAMGDTLVVAVQDDAGVQSSKGQRPILTLAERMEQLKALPFVDEVLSYSSQPGNDALAVCRRERPDVVVQGDDWLYSGERTEIIALLKQMRTRLILLPRTEHISSTEIKRRIHDSNRRDDLVLKNLQLLPLEGLSRYEEYDEDKVASLLQKIRQDGVYFNPLTVGSWDADGATLHIVVDGANRLEALRRLKAQNVPCMLFDYRQIELQPNVHYVQPDGSVRRASEFVTGEGERREFPPITREDIVRCVQEGRMVPSGATWHTPPCSVIRLRVPLAGLVDGSMTPEAFSAFVLKNELRGNIRYLQRSVYVCDEWES